MKNKDIERFILAAKKLHGDAYVYSAYYKPSAIKIISDKMLATEQKEDE